MRSPRSAVRALAALVAVAALAACGSTGRSAGPSPAPSATTSAPGPTEVPPSSPSPARCDNAAVVSHWSLDRRAAALVAVPVLDFDAAGTAAEVRAGVGGILFLGTAAPPADLARRIASLGADAGAGGPPLVMVDEEGGGIQRLVGAVPDLPWPRDLAATMTPAQVRVRAESVARAMAALGVTVDLAPVLDVDDRPGPSRSNPDGARSFSGDPAVVTRYGAAFVAGLRAGGVLPVVKHFPGLGGSTGNTDYGPVPTLPLSDLRGGGLLPFRAAVAAGAPAVMVANASVPGLSTQPASLSSAVVTGLLRHELGFDGLVVTDSLSAGAVTAAVPTLPAAAVAAVSAGADLVLFGSTLTAEERALLAPDRVAASFETIVRALVAAVQAGTLPQRRLDAAVLHVLAAKHVDLCR